MKPTNNASLGLSDLPIVFNSKEDLKEKIGLVLGTTEWLTVTQEMINDFAKATFDNQWIHLETERAKTNLPNGKTIAHGYLTMSLAAQFLYQLIKIENLHSFVNYGINRARFINPVMSGSDLRMHATIANVEEQANGGVKLFFNCSIQIKDQEKPAFVAEIISLIF